MNPITRLALAVLLLTAATVHAQQHHMRTAPARRQAAPDQVISPKLRTGAPYAPTAAKTTASDTLQRIRSIYINYGSGDDSVRYYYKSQYRGSLYDYSPDQQLYGYDGGFHYLQQPEAFASFDSLDYITRTDHISAYSPYLRTILQYAADTVLQPFAGKTDRPDGSGVYGPSTRFMAAYTAAGDLALQNNFSWDASLLQYDSSFLQTNTWYAPGKLQSQENIYFTAPYPARSANSYRLLNYYTSSGLLYREDYQQYDAATGGWKTTRIYTYTFTPAGKVATKATYSSSDTGIVRSSYNAAGQLIADSSFKWNASIGWGGGWSTTVDEIHSYTYPNTTAAAYAMMKHYFNISTGIRLFDSTVQTFSGAGKLLFNGEYHFNPNNGDPGDFFTRSVTYNAAGHPVNMLQQEFYAGSDTASYFAGLTYNAAGNPASRISIWTDAYGNPEPDTFRNIYERYGYETYVIPQDTAHPTGIAHSSNLVTDIQVFPNPAGGELHISCNAVSSARMTITASNGQIARSHAVTLGAGAAIIDVSGLAPGMYFVMLRDTRSGVQAITSFIRQ